MPFADALHEKLLNLISLYQIITSRANNTLKTKLKHLVGELLKCLTNLSEELITENREYDSLLKETGSKVTHPSIYYSRYVLYFNNHTLYYMYLGSNT